MGLFNHRRIARNRMGNWIEIHTRLFAPLAISRHDSVHDRELRLPVPVAQNDPNRHRLRRLDWNRCSGHGVVWNHNARRTARCRKTALPYPNHWRSRGPEVDICKLAGARFRMQRLATSRFIANRRVRQTMSRARPQNEASCSRATTGIAIPDGIAALAACQD